MKHFLAFMFWPLALPAATLELAPATITECQDSLGRARVRWTGVTPPAELRVGSPRGTLMTVVIEPAGEATTGDWVTDGLAFFLVSSTGVVEANAIARVRCGEASGSPWFPLDLGNTWVYRVNSRAATSTYVTHHIAGTETLNGRAYAILHADGRPLRRLRADAEGRVWAYAATGDTLLLDPARATETTQASPLGPFSGARSFTRTEPLLRQDEVYARGIGLVNSRSTLLTGSSGGFVEGLELVEARLANGLRLGTPAPRFSLAAESLVLDVTGRKVTNCAIPSYCVACGLIGADPPGTWKPCFQTRLDISHDGPYSIDLTLADAAGAIVAQSTINATGDTVRYIQLPLYRTPGHQPFAPGAYTLTGVLKQGATSLARTELSIRLD